MSGEGERAPMELAAEWVEGRLGPAEARLAEQQAASDPDFRGDVAFVRMVASAGEEMPLVEPPPVLRQRLRQSFQQWHRAPARHDARAGDGLLEVFASLVFDSRRQQLQLAVRGAATAMGGPVVHLMWQCELADLMLEARAGEAPDLVDLRGQVLLAHASASPVFTAVVSGAERRAESVVADELGRFRVIAPREVTSLRVSNGELAIVAELDLSPDRSTEEPR